MAAATAGTARTIHAYGSKTPGVHHERVEVELGPIGDNEVEIQVEYCGICHSDISLSKQSWGPGLSAYPGVQISGHEVIGRAVAVGKGVPAHKDFVGKRFGVGWYKNACKDCHACKRNSESNCAMSVPTAAAGSIGGFAEVIRVPYQFAIPIPESLDPAAAAPLLCGGITVYTPLVEHAAVGKKVGVFGLGGLGSMAVQLARARGNHVTVLSGSADKAALSKELGAHEFLLTSDAAALKAAADSLDLIILTVNVPVDYAALFNMLRLNGKLHIVGAILEPVPVSLMGSFMFKNLSLSSSATGGLVRIEELLEFAGYAGVKPLVEVFPASKINEALEKVESNKVRFRAVIKHGE